MTGLELLTAAVAATTVVVFAGTVVRPPQRLTARLAPYSDRTRARLGTTVAQRATGRTSVWGPLVAALANGLATLLDANRTDDMSLRLRHAGMRISVEDYRRRQLGFTVAALTGGLLLALLLRLSTGATLLVIAASGMIGLTRWRSTIDRRTSTRRATMRAETHTFCQLLAIYLRTGDTPIGALERLIERTTGTVSDELAGAVSEIRNGSTAATVLERLGLECAEPSTGRLYRLYGATWSASGDPDALLALSDDLVAARREDLARTMAKRRTAMVIPLVVILGPILVLFIAAPLPSLIFGR